MTTNNEENKILDELAVKSSVKQEAFTNTLAAFNTLKGVLQNITSDYNAQLSNLNERVSLEFSDKGLFVAQVRVAGDLLIFSMHSNIFEFDRENKVWETEYLKKDPLNSYCGIINIYNFLDDSFQYQRLDDLGYLIARLFVNKNDHFFVEGKRQSGYLYKTFGKTKISKTNLRKIISRAMGYALAFDLLVPPYENVKIATVRQLSEKMNISQLKTGKRLGFQFNSDDVFEDES